METPASPGPAPGTRFAILQLGRIGDLILLTPVFREIKRNLPSAHITLIAGRHNASIAEADKNVDEVLIYEKSFLKLIRFILTLRRRRFDIYLDPKDHESTEGRLIASLVKAPRKFGWRKSSVFSDSVHSGGNVTRHYTDAALHVLKTLGMSVTDNKPQLFPNGDSEEYVRKYYAGVYGKKVVLNISASSQKKMWANACWKDLIVNIDPQNYDISISFAPTEKDAAAELAGMCPGVRLFRSRSLSDTVSLVRACDAVITPDTAVVHISAAFDKPLLALYSWVPGFLEKFRPLNTRYVMIKTEKGVDGIGSISPGEVIRGWKTIEALL